MLNIKEDLLQFIWLNKLLRPSRLICVSGKEIQVLRTGDLNSDSGPDFFNAHIRLDDLVLAGNIEIHIKTSDWLKHGHQNDTGYDNLILHVVYEHDRQLKQNEQHKVEVLELKNYIDNQTLNKYEVLCESKEELPCKRQLGGVEEIKFTTWFERMAIERLESKVKRIEDLFQSCKGDFTQTFYTLLLRNFGFNVNALPFELLAKHLPVHLVLKHSDNLLQLEALFLGTAGMLDEGFENKYLQGLQNEYQYLKNKYHLLPLDKKIMKFSRLRPANFPNLRLAQFASFLNQHALVLQSPQNYSKVKQLSDTLRIKLSGYWQNHYSPDGKAQDTEFGLGEDSAENILINTFAPFFFFYSKKLLKPRYADLAIHILQSCKFEFNKKTKLFSEKNKVLKTAADSQACIQLYDNYCSKKQCLRCGIAAAILKTV